MSQENKNILPPDPEAILEVRNLQKRFVLAKTLMGKPTKELVAVDNVSFKLKAGETLTAKAVAVAAIALMPEGSRPGTPNGTEMTARGVIAVLNCIKIEK